MAYHVLQINLALSWNAKVVAVDQLLSSVKPGDLVVISSFAHWTNMTCESMGDLRAKTQNWANEAARKLRCFVIVGYPKIIDDRPRFACMGFDMNGKQCARHYENEKRKAVKYTSPLDQCRTIKIGISRDLSHTFCQEVLDEASNLVILLMENILITEKSKTDLLLLWVASLEPLIEAKTQYVIDVVFANRTGTEGGLIYSGTSAVFRIHKGEIFLCKALSQDAMDVLSFDTECIPTRKFSKFDGKMYLTGCCCPYDYFGIMPTEKDAYYNGMPITTTPPDTASIICVMENPRRTQESAQLVRYRGYQDIGNEINRPQAPRHGVAGGVVEVQLSFATPQGDETALNAEG